MTQKTAPVEPVAMKRQAMSSLIKQMATQSMEPPEPSEWKIAMQQVRSK